MFYHEVQEGSEEFLAMKKFIITISLLLFVSFTFLSVLGRLTLGIDCFLCLSPSLSRFMNPNIRFIKLKLCKHKGMQGSLAMISYSRENNLKIVYGNGVQTAVGNHLEARVYSQALLTTAIESNGFLKIKDSKVSHELKTRGGKLFSGGLKRIFNIFNGETPVISFSL